MPKWKTIKSGTEVTGYQLKTKGLVILLHQTGDPLRPWLISCTGLVVIRGQYVESWSIKDAQREGLNLIRRRARAAYLEARYAMGLGESI